MFTNTVVKNGETKKTIAWGTIAIFIALIVFTTIIFVSMHNHAINEKREDGRLVTITAFTEHEPHRETIAMWDVDNNYTNEHYTNIEYYEYSGTFVVEVTTYDGENLGKFEVKPAYYGEDEIFVGAEIEKYKLQPIKRDIEKIKRQVPNKELLQDIKPVEKQELEQNLVPIETRTQELVLIKNK